MQPYQQQCCNIIAPKNACLAQCNNVVSLGMLRSKHYIHTSKAVLCIITHASTCSFFNGVSWHICHTCNLYIIWVPLTGSDVIKWCIILKPYMADPKLLRVML